MIEVTNTEGSFEVRITKFPNRESLVHTEDFESIKEPFKVFFKFFEDEDILHLFFVLEHLKDMGKTDFDLVIKYMPYSRMDRNQNGNCFTLKHVCKLIKSALSENNKIYVVEPHSDVTVEKLGATKINASGFLTDTVLKNPVSWKVDVICFPDKGAKARFSEVIKTDLHIVYCNKVRDFDTGEIKGLEIASDTEVDLKGKNVLIVDDLCSKGGTFYFTAKKLKEEGANLVQLVVTHMESAVKDGRILKYSHTDEGDIVHILCTDSMLSTKEVQDITCNTTNVQIPPIDVLISNYFIGGNAWY